MKSLLSRLATVRSLLAPDMQTCLFCGKNSQAASALPGICRSCENSIPWIRCPRCLKCGRQVGCPDCSRSSEPAPIVCNRSAVAYSSGMRELLGRYKYRGDERLAYVLGLMLDRAYSLLKDEREQAMRSSLLLHSQKSLRPAVRTNKCNTFWQADLLVPVPVSDTRLAERGFNQAERLADVLSRRRGVPQLPLLVRTHHTGKQSFKTRAERLADMKHAFAISTDCGVLTRFAGKAAAVRTQDRPLQIIIIDDIYTTGSTIRACADSILRQCMILDCAAEVYSLTWARS